MAVISVRNMFWRPFSLLDMIILCRGLYIPYPAVARSQLIMLLRMTCIGGWNDLLV
jgi:hypothetical protein